MIRSTSRILLAASAAAAFAASPASADDYCVDTSPCSTANVYSDTSLQAALDAAAAHPGPDRVLVGEGTYTGSFDAGKDSATEIVGEGAGETVIVSSGLSQIALSVDGKDASVSRVKVARGAGGGAALRLSNGARGRELLVFTSGNAGAGVELSGGGVIEGSWVNGPVNGSAVSVSGGANRVRWTTLNGGATGVRLAQFANAAVERSRLQGFSFYGVYVDGGSAKVEDTLVDARAASASGIAVAARSYSDVNGPIGLELKRSTVVGGGAGQTGVLARGDNAGEQVTAAVRDTVIHGFGKPTECSTADGGTAYLYGTHNNLPAQGNVMATCVGPSSGWKVDHSAHEPNFVNADGGDFHPSPDSGLVDAGNPAATPGSDAVDNMGMLRVVDGDGDGKAVHDIGAFEYAPPQPTEPPAPAEPDPVAAPEPTAPAADNQPGTPAPAADPPATPETVTHAQEASTPAQESVTPARDTVAPVITAVRVKRGRRVSFSLSEATQVTVITQLRKSTRRTRAVAGRAGANAVRLPRLKRGSYRIRVVAVDLAGNRTVSPARRLVVR